MTNTVLKKTFASTTLFFLTTIFSTYLFAAENEYSSQFINQSNQNHSQGYRLVKTRMWPSSDCLLDTGKQIINPGESTTLKIKKDPSCNESGIGYSIYRVEDTNNSHLLGYVSHRFANGKFSIQISRFCEAGKCVLMDLNPEQKR